MLTVFWTMFMIALPISFIITLVRMIKTGTLQREIKRQKRLFFVGLVPVIVLGIMVCIFGASGKIIQAIATSIVMFVWSVAVMCIEEIKKKK